MCEPRDITIGFSTTDKFMSRFIRWVMRSPCSHTWLAFYDETLDLRLVMQAEAWGYEVRPWHLWKKQNKLVAEFKPLGNSLDKSIRYMAQRLGTKYDFLGAIISGLKHTFKFMSGGDTNRLMCAEAVKKALSYAKYKAVKGLSIEGTSVKRLLGRCLMNPNEFKPLKVSKKVLKYYKLKEVGGERL